MHDGTKKERGIMHYQELEHFDEMLDIVDNNDCVTGSMHRALVYQKNLCSQIRAVWLIIRNDQGQLWIPRRSWKVQLLPGHLDGSVVGHVRAGESYEQALLREAQEEIGCDMSMTPYRLLGKLTPAQHKTFSFFTVYECTLNEAPQNWNRDDIGEWYWMTPQEVLDKLEQGEKMKDGLPIVIKEFYQQK